MDGKSAYEESCLIGHEWGIVMPAWNQLSPEDRAAWEQTAFENEKEDRECTTLFAS